MIMLQYWKNQPKRPWKKKEIPVIDARRRAILSAFAFHPYKRPHREGLHSVEIMRMAPHTFKKLFVGSHRDRNPGQIISSLCRSLVTMGYLKEGQRVSRTYTPRGPSGGEPRAYMSPKWLLTETGYWWILSNCNFDHAICEADYEDKRFAAIFNREEEFRHFMCLEQRTSQYEDLDADEE